MYDYENERDARDAAHGAHARASSVVAASTRLTTLDCRARRSLWHCARVACELCVSDRILLSPRRGEARALRPGWVHAWQADFRDI